MGAVTAQSLNGNLLLLGFLLFFSSTCVEGGRGLKACASARRVPARGHTKSNRSTIDPREELRALNPPCQRGNRTTRLGGSVGGKSFHMLMFIATTMSARQSQRLIS